MIIILIFGVSFQIILDILSKTSAMLGKFKDKLIICKLNDTVNY